MPTSTVNGLFSSKAHCANRQWTLVGKCFVLDSLVILFFTHLFYHNRRVWDFKTHLRLWMLQESNSLHFFGTCCTLFDDWETVNGTWVYETKLYKGHVISLTSTWGFRLTWLCFDEHTMSGKVPVHSGNLSHVAISIQVISELWSLLFILFWCPSAPAGLGSLPSLSIPLSICYYIGQTQCLWAEAAGRRMLACSFHLHFRS